jgi:hypothetical protein
MDFGFQASSFYKLGIVKHLFCYILINIDFIYLDQIQHRLVMIKYTFIIIIIVFVNNYYCISE